jgi:pimeloyl-ACP methyl ester carboxylesterase
MIEDPRGDIDYAEEGSGPTIVFVPGSWDTRAAWRGVIPLLRDRFRIVTTSLLGYGGTKERRTTTDSSIDREAEIVEAVVRHAGDAAHLVGHSFGGQVCLAVALRRIAPVLSLTVIEPTAVNLLRRAGELLLYEQIIALRDRYFPAFESGDKEAARYVIDFFNGNGTFNAFSQRTRDYIVATTASNVLDWRSGMGVDEPSATYAAISVPTLVIRGEHGHPSTARSAEVVSNAIPNAFLATVAGASHLAMATHPNEVARLMIEHLSKLAVGTGR